MNAVEVRNLSKEFNLNLGARSLIRQFSQKFASRHKKNKISALKDINFSVKKGEIFGIVGSNGSGKSTLLRIIAGIYHPTSGEIVKGGEIAPFFQWGLGFYPDLTIKDNIYVYGAFLGLARRQLNGKVDGILNFADLDNYANAELRTCSTGMVSRFAFSIMMQAQPDILIIDEFQEIGDLNFQKKFFEVLDDFRKNGRTIILVSHNLEIIKKLCQHVLYLKEGTQIMVDKAEVVIDKYKTESS